jgi:hypothetical protein
MEHGHQATGIDVAEPSAGVPAPPIFHARVGSL